MRSSIRFIGDGAEYVPSGNEPRQMHLKTKTHHNHQVVFGKLVDDCPRCDELRDGASVRKGWGHRKQEAERLQLQAIRNHDCKKAGCLPICTFGDW